MPVLVGAELEFVPVRAPHQASDIDASPGGSGEDGSDLGARSGQSFISVPPPVREHEPVATLHRLDRGEEIAKVDRSVNQRSDLIPGRPCQTVWMTSVQV